MTDDTLALICATVFCLFLGVYLIVWNVVKGRKERRRRAIIRHLEEICGGGK